MIRYNTASYLANEKKRFFSKVDTDGPVHPYNESLGKCHIWTGAVNSKWGYGNFGARGKTYRAHVFSYELEYGPIESGSILHSCDVKLCVNPLHLWVGTHDQNMSDMTSKRRQVYGIDKWCAVLTEEQVKEIRTRYRHGLGRRLATEFGISQQHLSDIVTGKKWKILLEEDIYEYRQFEKTVSDGTSTVLDKEQARDLFE